MSDKNRKSNQFIPNWPSSHAPKNTPESTKTASILEESLDLVSTNDLQQGELYIIKIKLIAVALFQGWDDAMCCFSILRTDLLEDLRWSEARYLPENFDAYLAFDYAGNPPIHLWTKHLRAVIPINWFNIFEEARHMQRQWNVSFWDPNNYNNKSIEDGDHKIYYNLTDTSITTTEQEVAEEEEGQIGVVNNEDISSKEIAAFSLSPTLPLQQQRKSILAESPMNKVTVDHTTTPAMRLQNQYIVTQQQQQKDLEQIEQQTNLNSTPPKRPEIKQRRSFSSFFLKKKKSKKSLHSSNSEDDKRKSAPPTPFVDEKYHHQKSVLSSSSNITDNKEHTSIPTPPVPHLIASHSSTSSTTRNNRRASPTTKNENDKLELFDIDSYFAFLNTTDTFSSLKNKKTITTN